MPKISVALTGRNDNYGGNWLQVTEFSIQSIQRALKGVDHEIVLLDYNPPSDRPLLSECFPVVKYPTIKHVVFSNEEHIEFLNCHLGAGAKVLLKGKEVPADKILKIPYIGAFAFTLSIKNCTGDYILSTGSDNIFPIQFGEFVKKLKPNILYRTWSYRTKNNINKILSSTLSGFDEYSDYKKIKGKERCQFKISKTRVEFDRSKTGTVNSSPGNFSLMDKNSWVEVGSYLPTMNPRLPQPDTQFIFHALTCGKKIGCANFPIFNIHRPLGNTYKKYDRNSNYIVSDGQITYDHMQEIKKWGEFKKWSRHAILKPGKEYFIQTSYKDRFSEARQLFKSFLPDKFLIR